MLGVRWLYLSSIYFICVITTYRLSLSVSRTRNCRFTKNYR